MSVLVKGMEMPTRCDDCVMGHELAVGTSVTGYGCLAMLRMGDARIRPISCGTRPDWCPLIEVPTPHGRLIDADEFDDRIRTAGGMCEEELTDDFKDGVQTVLAMLKTQPTIIEAEGKDISVTTKEDGT